MPFSCSAPESGSSSLGSQIQTPHPVLFCLLSTIDWLYPKCNICTICTMRLRKWRKKLNFCVRDILRGPFTCTCLAVLWLGSRCLALLVEQHVRLICANVIFIDLLHFVVVKHPPSCPTHKHVKAQQVRCFSNRVVFSG